MYIVYIYIYICIYIYITKHIVSMGTEYRPLLQKQFFVYSMS